MDDRAQPQWEERPDGSRIRTVNGIRIIDRRHQHTVIEHLVARRDADGRVVVLGLDAQRRTVYATTLNAPS
jgi:hypothetical protein